MQKTVIALAVASIVGAPLGHGATWLTGSLWERIESDLRAQSNSLTLHYDPKSNSWRVYMTEMKTAIDIRYGLKVY